MDLNTPTSKRKPLCDIATLPDDLERGPLIGEMRNFVSIKEHQRLAAKVELIERKTKKDAHIFAVFFFMVSASLVYVYYLMIEQSRNV